MTALRVFFFAEFAAVALAAPALGLLCRRVTSKLALACVPLALAAAPLAAVVHLWVPAQPVWAAVCLQLLVAAFALAASGAAALLGRRWTYGGAVAATLLALAVLATPFWGDLAWNLDNSRVRSAAQTWLVRASPLLTVAKDLGNFDWTHGPVLYSKPGGIKMTRLGEDFPYAPSPAWLLGLCYAGLGLAAAAGAGLVRRRGRLPVRPPTGLSAPPLV